MHQARGLHTVAFLEQVEHRQVLLAVLDAVYGNTVFHQTAKTANSPDGLEEKGVRRTCDDGLVQDDAGRECLAAAVAQEAAVQHPLLLLSHHLDGSRRSEGAPLQYRRLPQQETAAVE